MVVLGIKDGIILGDEVLIPDFPTLQIIEQERLDLLLHRRCRKSGGNFVGQERIFGRQGFHQRLVERFVERHAVTVPGLPGLPAKLIDRLLQLRKIDILKSRRRRERNRDEWQRGRGEDRSRNRGRYEEIARAFRPDRGSGLRKDQPSPTMLR